VCQEQWCWPWLQPSHSPHRTKGKQMLQYRFLRKNNVKSVLSKILKSTILGILSVVLNYVIIWNIIWAIRSWINHVYIDVCMVSSCNSKYISFLVLIQSYYHIYRFFPRWALYCEHEKLENAHIMSLIMVTTPRLGNNFLGMKILWLRSKRDLWRGFKRKFSY